MDTVNPLLDGFVLRAWRCMPVFCSKYVINTPVTIGMSIIYLYIANYIFISAYLL